jgi:G3E family GTPase
MIREVKKIHRSQKYDYLFIEATGISTPLPVAQAFHASESIMKIVEIYSMITVIDAENFLLNLTSNEIIEEEEQISKRLRRSERNKMLAKHRHQQEELDDDEKPTISELMINQLEIANLIIVNKVDLVTKEQLEKVMIYLKSINQNT